MLIQIKQSENICMKASDIYICKMLQGKKNYAFVKWIALSSLISFKLQFHLLARVHPSSLAF